MAMKRALEACRKMSKGGVVNSVLSDGSRHGKYEENEPEQHDPLNPESMSNYSEPEHVEHLYKGGMAGGGELATEEYPSDYEAVEQEADGMTGPAQRHVSDDEATERKRMFAMEAARKLSASKRGSMAR